MNYANEIAAERKRAHSKHGDKSQEGEPWDSARSLRILVEEVGEAAKVLNEYDLENMMVYEAMAELRSELIQVATMAVVWVANIDRGLVEVGEENDE